MVLISCFSLTPGGKARGFGWMTSSHGPALTGPAPRLLLLSPVSSDSWGVLGRCTSRCWPCISTRGRRLVDANAPVCPLWWTGLLGDIPRRDARAGLPLLRWGRTRSSRERSLLLGPIPLPGCSWFPGWVAWAWRRSSSTRTHNLMDGLSARKRLKRSSPSPSDSI